MSSRLPWRVKKANPEAELALEKLAQRLLITLRFFEGVQDFRGGATLRGMIETAAAKRDMRSLRLMAREIDAMATALFPEQREGLEAILEQRVGVDKDAERAELQKRVAAVLERGSIASEKERRRLEDYAEMLEATGGNPAEIRAVRRLLESG